jgi:hypothetical protein
MQKWISGNSKILKILIQPVEWRNLLHRDAIIRVSTKSILFPIVFSLSETLGNH